MSDPAQKHASPGNVEGWFGQTSIPANEIVEQTTLGSNNQPLAVSVAQFCELTSLGRTSCYKMLQEGRIEARRIGRRTLILMSSVETLLDLRSAEGKSK